MIREATGKLIERKDLSCEEAGAVMDEIMKGEAAPVPTAAFLAALAAKGETAEEISACAAVLRSHATPVRHGFDLLEIVGTGGDGAKTFNISTTAALVAAAGGVRVAKHGNRAASSKCGSADCLEALGVNISLSPERCLRLLEDIGICFFFAPRYHPAMRRVAELRREMGVRTIFNILGPLANPASANMQLLGVFSEELVRPMALALRRLGVKRGMVVYGRDGLDEISVSAPTAVCEFEGDEMKSYVLRPEDCGLAPRKKSELEGGSPEKNAKIALDILGGMPGAGRDAVLINSAAAFLIAGRAAGLSEGMELAARLIDSGAARAKLDEFIAKSNEGGPEE